MKINTLMQQCIKYKKYLNQYIKCANKTFKIYSTVYKKAISNGSYVKCVNKTFEINSGNG